MKVQFTHVANRLLPTKYLLNAFTLALTGLISFVPCRSCINGTSALGMLRDMWCDVACPEVFHERLNVVTFVGT